MASKTTKQEHIEAATKKLREDGLSTNQFSVTADEKAGKFQLNVVIKDKKVSLTSIKAVRTLDNGKSLIVHLQHAA